LEARPGLAWRIMKLIFAGTPDTAVPVAEAVGAAHEIQAVLTRPAAPVGRSSRLVPSPVEQWARRQGIEVLAPDKVRDPAVAARLGQLAPDCCVVVAYGGLITRRLLEIPRHGWINLHFSLLPAYRGAAPVQQAILDGCEQTGVTTFRLVEALDAGPVFVQRAVTVGEDETAGDLLERLSQIGAGVMVETLDLAGGGYCPAEQPGEGISWAPKISPEQARLAVSAPAQAFVNRVRAMSPQPGAWMELDSQRFKILRAAVVRAERDLGMVLDSPPGTLWATKKKLFYRAADAWVELVEVQATGKKPLAGADWARGAWHQGASLG